MLDEDLIAEYREHSRRGAHFAAIAKLGELYFRLAGTRRGSSDTPAALNIEPGFRVELHIALAALAEGKDALRRALRILVNGGKYEWEELVWVLTLRTQIRFIKIVLAPLDLDCGELDLSVLDAELKESTSNAANRSTMASAVTTIARNWGLAAEDVWTAA